ncbi:MAG: glycosyltransferase [Alphaproteobacteria bacterium]
MDYFYDLTIILPTYNEAKNIRVLCKRLDIALEGLKYEVLIADDNSPDQTWAHAHALAKQQGNVRVLRRFIRRGLSAACIDAAQAAMGRRIVVMDADLQHDETIIPALLEELDKGADIALGSRFAEGGSTDGLSSPLRQRLSSFGVKATATILGKSVADPLTGFFAINTEKFQSLVPKLSDSGFKILFDILFVDRALKVSEVGFKFAKRIEGESKLDSATIWQFLTYLGQKITFDILPARLISFGVVGLSGVAVHFAALLAFRGFITDEPFWQGQLFATLVALMTNFALNNKLTFTDRKLSGRPYWIGLGLFAVASSVGILGNISVSSYLENVGTQGFALSAIAGITVDTVWKYAVAQRIIWRR